MQCSDTISSPALKTIIGEHGAGMVELYWLKSMEKIRQNSRLHDVYRHLFSATWGSGCDDFKPDTEIGDNFR
jgi:hypothetical protein